GPWWSVYPNCTPILHADLHADLLRAHRAPPQDPPACTCAVDSSFTRPHRVHLSRYFVPPIQVMRTENKHIVWTLSNTWC
ncbi:MAG: hypothetical protein M3256_23985, partial [Actinomycetota bacterium]|nr:hypothetical protein [Actinomycetota bacterium]